MTTTLTHEQRNAEHALRVLHIQRRGHYERTLRVIADLEAWEREAAAGLVDSMPGWQRRNLEMLREDRDRLAQAMADDGQV